MTSDPPSGEAGAPDGTPAPRSAVSRARRVAGRSHVVQQTRTEQTRTEQTRTEQTRTEQTRTEQTRTEPTRTEQTRTEPTRTASTVAAEDRAARREARAAAAPKLDEPSRDDLDPDAENDTDTDAASAPASRAGRNLPAAIGVGVGLGIVIIATLFLYRPSFAALVGVVVLYAAWELTRAMRSAGIRVTLLPVLVGSAATLVAAWERGPTGLVLGGLITVLGVWVWRLGDGADGYGRDVAASTFAVLYLPVLAGFAIMLAHTHDGAGRVLAFIAVVVCSDTGGYATGVLFGRHPLAPIVSKGKTWEGFAGSVLACSAAGILFMVFTFHEAWWKGLLFGLALVVTATVGDLGESMIKRDLGIKDMGTLLPGHGGVMDRLDSLLPCAAVAYLILSGFAPV